MFPFFAENISHSMNKFFTPFIQRFYYDAKLSADEENWHFQNPEYSGKSLKSNTDTFTDGSSDRLLSVNVKLLLNFEGNVVQNVH